LGVEIGPGAGWLSAAVLREFPEAGILGLDGSPEMLRTAAEVLAPHRDRAELRGATIRPGLHTMICILAIARSHVFG
jgi:trans-aconitate methyltransferase